MPDKNDNGTTTKFVMAANKLGIVKGYADGEFKPQRTITISEMTKILIKVKELKQNSLVSENTIQKIQNSYKNFMLVRFKLIKQHQPYCHH